MIVLSSCPLYPRDETGLPLLRIPGWRSLGGWTLTRKGNGEHGSSDSVPGLSYSSIEIVLGLRRHTLWSFWVDLREEGYAPLVSPVAMPGVPKSDRRPVWRRRRFFISSVDDSVLERSPFASASGSVAMS